MTDNLPAESIKDIATIRSNSRVIDFQEMLPKDKYDIDYMISFCVILMRQIEKMKFNPKDLAFTLDDSLKRLYGYLMIEKNQLHAKMHTVNLQCQNCDFIETIFSHLARDWKCKECEERKELKKFAKS
jgi:hypothetical protein